MTRIARRIPRDAGVLLLAVALLAPTRGAAQPAPTGFSPAAAERQLRAEAAAIERIRPATLDSFSHALTRVPHIAGGPGQMRTRDWVLGQTRAWGLESDAPRYRIWLPWPTAAELELVAPVRQSFDLRERVLSGDPATALPQYPWVNGFSGAGDAEAEVVYVNYGLHEDYARLDSLGVSVEGRIALARYGRSYRGVKARLAEEHGAAGLILYSDPVDDGFVRGPVYPDGTWRPPTGVQRGSILGGAGDPTTPDGPSTVGADRADPRAAAGFFVPSIPVMPVGYAVAQPILAALGGPRVPADGWEGGLPVPYRVGPGPARVRMRVADDRDTDYAYKDVWNTIARIPGTERPDEWVVVGAHRDAWGAGANDNASGTAAVLAAARAIAELAAAGHPPRRTIIFATWDAEEWGLIGSTEWVEEHADALGANAVAYLNQDAIASGPHFGAAASPSLKALVREAAHVVPSPAGGTLHDRWADAARTAQCAAGAPAGDAALGDLGGGSDYAGFYNHLGVPSAGWGFGGGWGQYHSAYDTYAWMSRFGDPGFENHAASARLLATVALRLANAEVLPYDYGEFACQLRGAATRLAGTAQAEAEFAALDHAFRAMEDAARAFGSARAAALRSGTGDVDRANARLLEVERALTREEGLEDRPWYRNLVFAADRRNGYATIALPSIAEAIQDGDARRIRAEVLDLTRRVEAATREIEAATEALR